MARAIRYWIVSLLLVGFVQAVYADRADDLGLLGLGTDANRGQIDAAYRKLLKSTHPDTAGQKAKEWALPESEIPAIAKRLNDKFAVINAAYDRLTGRSTVTPPSYSGGGSSRSGSGSSRARAESFYRALLNEAPEFRRTYFEKVLDARTGQPTAEEIHKILYFGITEGGLNAHEAASLIDSYFSTCKSPCTADRAKLLGAAYGEIDGDFSLLRDKLVPINIAVGTLLHDIGTEEAYRELIRLQIKGMRISMEYRLHGAFSQAKWFTKFHKNLASDLERRNPTYRTGFRPGEYAGLCLMNAAFGLAGY